MKSKLIIVTENYPSTGDTKYQALAFMCPGCMNFGGSGLHMLAVNTEVKQPSWTWDGNLDAPTLTPSILTKSGYGKEFICHSYLTAGVFKFLGDCTHGFANKEIPIPDLPDWFTE